jgi:Zn-dependent peptidase ImmA (M78 family)
MRKNDTETEGLDQGPRKKFAIAMAQKLLRAAGITEAPVSLRRIIECAEKDRKLTVIMDKIPGNLSGIMVKVGELDEASTFISVNADDPWCRRRFTLGHELGHMFLEHAGCAGSGTYEEREAHVFSAELLIPKALIKQDIKKTPNIPALAKRYLVSQQALTIKLQDCKLI